MLFLALLPNLMGSDGLMIFLFILLFFGAKRLPELAKGLGSAVREFSKAKDEIEHEITRPPSVQPHLETPRDTHAQTVAATPPTSATEGVYVAPVTGVAAPVTPAPVHASTDPHV